MYTDEELNLAVKKGIFSEESVSAFREYVATSKNTPRVDEETFKLIGGFNDIFVVIACSLLLFSSWWVLSESNKSLGLLIFTALSWFLSEVFVRKRKMALPAIGLLLSFVGGVFAFLVSLFPNPNEWIVVLGAFLSAIAAYLHWLRFKVPITVAAGAAASVATLLALLASVFPALEDLMLLAVFICGIAVFFLAMYWDASDLERTTRKSDVAFWLHLLAAPLVIHPVFYTLGILGGDESLLNMLVVLVLYLLMTFVSIVVDRRAFMVSSLAYVIYALSSLIQNYGGVGYSFALTGVFMGSALLLLSAWWHPVRGLIVVRLPELISRYVPSTKES